MRPIRPWTLLRLYPRAWRDRYGDEFVALLEREGTGPRVVLNVLAGAFDAWVSPKVVDAYAPADANTLRFWRVQMPPDNRTFSERMPQLLWGGALFGVLQIIAWRTDWETLQRGAGIISIGVSSIPFWYEGYSLRTKTLAMAAMAAMTFGIAWGFSRIWP